MPRTNKGEKRANSTGATIGYEARLWQMGDALGRNTGAVEHKHVVLGLFFRRCARGWDGRRIGRCHLQGHGLCPERLRP